MAMQEATPIQRLERFWSFVKKRPADPRECWLWTGSRSPSGYGLFYSGDKRHGPAHRYIYGALIARIPDGMWVLHHCDNPPCVRPEHLFLGTHQDNMDDMASKGRGAIGIKPGGSRILTPDQVREIRYALTTVPRWKPGAQYVGVTGRGNRGKSPGFVNALAARYGVSNSVIYQIAQKRKWWYID